MPGVIGRMIGQPPAAPRRNLSRDSDGANRPQGDGRAKAATNADVKRQVERQIRETLGDKVQSVQVRVSGKNVLIVAKPAWFWQKRAVRRTLESLSVLDGYRVKVDLGD
jgi:hypothetical protein